MLVLEGIIEWENVHSAILCVGEKSLHQFRPNRIPGTSGYRPNRQVSSALIPTKLDQYLQKTFGAHLLFFRHH